MELAVLSGRQGQLTPWRETPGAGEGTLILVSSLVLCKGYWGQSQKNKIPKDQ